MAHIGIKGPPSWRGRRCDKRLIYVITSPPSEQILRQPLLEGEEERGKRAYGSSNPANFHTCTHLAYGCVKWVWMLISDSYWNCWMQSPNSDVGKVGEGRVSVTIWHALVVKHTAVSSVADLRGDFGVAATITILFLVTWSTFSEHHEHSKATLMDCTVNSSHYFHRKWRTNEQELEQQII